MVGAGPSSTMLGMLAENELYDAGSELVEAATNIRRIAADPRASAAIPALLGCVETALAELSRACTELQTAVTATDARADRLRRGHHNLAEALDDAVTASRAARALAARCVAAGPARTA
jgi:hypothetical protein